MSSIPIEHLPEPSLALWETYIKQGDMGNSTTGEQSHGPSSMPELVAPIHDLDGYQSQSLSGTLSPSQSSAVPGTLSASQSPTPSEASAPSETSPGTQSPTSSSSQTATTTHPPSELSLNTTTNVQPEPSPTAKPNKKGHNIHFPPPSSIATYTPYTPYTTTPPSSPTEPQEDLKKALLQIPNLGYLKSEKVDVLTRKLSAPWDRLVLGVCVEAVRERCVEEESVLMGVGGLDVGMGSPISGEGTDNKKQPQFGKEGEYEAGRSEGQNQTYATLIKCLDTQIRDITLCTACTDIHTLSPPKPLPHTSSSYITTTTKHQQTKNPCPAQTPLSSPSPFTTTTPSTTTTLKRKKKPLFIAPLTFATLQSALKQHIHAESDRDESNKICRPLAAWDSEQRGLSREVYWWGSASFGGKFWVSSSSSIEGGEKPRILYRTQQFFHLKYSQRRNPKAYAEMQRVVNASRGLCRHVLDPSSSTSPNAKDKRRSKDNENEEKLWDFWDPGRYVGVKRCTQCAMEWEVSLGVISCSPIPTNNEEEGRMKEEKETKHQDSSSGENKNEEEEEEEEGEQEEAKPKKENLGSLLILSTWRDFGPCTDVLSPLWMAHFSPSAATLPLLPSPIATPASSPVSSSTSSLVSTNEEQGIGKIKTAFEGVPEYAEEGGDLNLLLEEKWGRKIKSFIGKLGELEGCVVSVKFCDVSKMEVAKQKDAGWMRVVKSVRGFFRYPDPDPVGDVDEGEEE